MHDPIKFSKPMKRLMAPSPLFIRAGVVGINTIFACQISIKLRGKRVEPLTQFLFLRRKLSGIHAVLSLHLMEYLKGSFDDLRFLNNAINLSSSEAERAVERFLHIVEPGKSDERVSGTDVKIDIRQRFQILDLIDLGDELEEQPQFADLNGFLHDIYAVEIVNDNRLEDEVGAISPTTSLWRNELENAVNWPIFTSDDGSNKWIKSPFGS